MIKKNCLLLFLLITTSIQAQETDNLTISELVLSHVNQLRDSLGLNKLALDELLNKAGEDQAYYMSDRGKLTHFQKTFSKETPAERISFHGGNRTYTGENIAYVNASWISRNRLNKVEVARSLYESWLNSPPHYANMVHPEFSKMGLGTWLNEERVYSAQVFSSNEIKLPAAFKNADLAWGVRPREKTCKDDEQVYETMFFANSVEVVGNDIYFYFHDVDFFKNVIQNENDGLAIDVVLREQLPCHKENQFHISNIYDGEMQQPIYKYDLFKNNISSNPRKIRVKIGTVPSYLAREQWSANIVVINNNTLCDYSIPSTLPSSIYPLLELDPYYELGQPAQQTPYVALSDSLRFTLNFERSESQYEKVDILSGSYVLWPKYAKKWVVDCYASVEGAEWFNKRLLDERKAIAKDFLAYSFEDSSAITWNLAENWEMMNQQIVDHDLHKLKGKSKQQIRYFLKRNRNPLMDSLLYEQRKTYISAILDTVIRIDSYDAFLIGSAYDSSLVLDDVNWNQILYRDYIAEESGVNSQLFDSLYTRSDLKTNLLGAGAIDYKNARFDSTKVEEFVGTIDEANSKQLFNYAHFLTTYWFAKYSRSSELKGAAVTLSPQELKDKLVRIDTNIIAPYDLDRLKINIYLSGIHYYVTHGNWTHVNAYFDAIANMVKENRFDADEAVGLALFCNHFHKFRQSIAILSPFFDRNELDENGLFIFAKTATLWKSNLDIVYYHSIMEAAKKVNLKRYCGWLDNYFQIQRDEYLKSDFCASC